MPPIDRSELSRAARTAGQAVADDTAPKPGRLWAEVLAQVPLFVGVSARHVRKIAALGSAVSFNAKTRIVSAGDPGDAFYVLLAGPSRVAARSRTPQDRDRPGRLLRRDGAVRRRAAVRDRCREERDDMPAARPQAVRESAQGRARRRLRAASHARCPSCASSTPQRPTDSQRRRNGRHGSGSDRDRRNEHALLLSPDTASAARIPTHYCFPCKAVAQCQATQEFAGFAQVALALPTITVPV